MDKVLSADPVDALMAKAKALGWPGVLEYAKGFQHPKLSALLAIWRDKAAAGIPMRAAFDAHVLKDVLPNVSIMERVVEGKRARYRCRLAGTAITRAVGGDGTGRFVDELVPEPFLARWIGVYGTVLKAGAALRLLSRYEVPQLDYLDSESFLAPLRADGDEPTLILTATYFSERKQT